MKIYTQYIITSICIIILICCITVSSFAQADTTKNEYQKAFDDFNKSIVDEFDSFKSKNDSIFYQFLEQSWRSFKLFTDTRPEIPKPVVQPVSDSVVQKSMKIIPSKRKTMLQDSGRQLILVGKPATYSKLSTVVPYTTFSFYGTDISIPKQSETAESLTDISNKVIALYYKESSNNDEILATIDFLHEQAYNTNLNGWGYLKLLQAASESIYANSNDQVLFTWLALLKSGYDARVGYDKNSIYLLAAFDMPIFYNSYFKLNKTNYYLVLTTKAKADLANITSYEGDYPEKLIKLSLFFDKVPNFKSVTKTRELSYNGKKVKLSYDANLTDYYSSYPECNIKIYFPPPLSKQAIKSIGNFLNPYFKNKSDAEKVNFLLNFVQHSIKYETDEKQFGTENYLFAEETICYPYADCEDRSVLLSQLISEFVGLNTIAIIYPGHVSLGVNIKDQIEGAYVEYNKRTYYIADPTYIGSKVGMLMPEFENIDPEIIEF